MTSCTQKRAAGTEINCLSGADRFLLDSPTLLPSAPTDRPHQAIPTIETSYLVPSTCTRPLLGACLHLDSSFALCASSLRLRIPKHCRLAPDVCQAPPVVLQCSAPFHAQLKLDHMDPCAFHTSLGSTGGIILQDLRQEQSPSPAKARSFHQRSQAQVTLCTKRDSCSRTECHYFSTILRIIIHQPPAQVPRIPRRIGFDQATPRGSARTATDATPNLRDHGSSASHHK